MKTASILALATMVAFTAPAFANNHETHHHDHAASAPAAADAPVDVYRDAMQKMHSDMTYPPTGNADVDFVKGMIPHHEGAVAMAKILKEKGKDPELQKMADEIIAAQEKEIAFMKEWLKKNGS